jgi:hypothetical protein
MVVNLEFSEGALMPVVFKQGSFNRVADGTLMDFNPENQPTIGEGIYAVIEGASNITAQSGSLVSAKAGTHVLAEDGSRVIAYEGSHVYAQAGSNVIAHRGSSVRARLGCTVQVHGGARVVYEA